MKYESRTIKRGITTVISLALACIIFLSTSVGIFASSKASKNRIAHAKLDNKLESMSSAYTEIRYQYTDVTGDGVDDLIMAGSPSLEGGSGDDYYIYTYYKNKKVKKIYSENDYGVVYFRYYKKTKSLVTYSCGHGGESYNIYQLKYGNYRYLGSKGRQSVNGGAEENGPWSYQNSNKEISKKKFKKIVKKIKKGSAKTYMISDWEYISSESEDIN